MKEKVLSVVEGISKWVTLIDSFGIFKILKAAFILCACIILIKGAVYLDPEKLVIKLQNIEATQAEEVRQFRKESDVIIKQEMDYLLNGLGADRVSVIEFHNGKSNPSGLGFYFGDMTHEKIAYGTKSVVGDWQNANLSWLTIDDILYRDGYWYGNIADLEKLDPLTAGKMAENGVAWTCFYLLEAVDEYNAIKELGILCVSFNEVPELEHQKEVGRLVRKVSPVIVESLYYKK